MPIIAKLDAIYLSKTFHMSQKNCLKIKGFHIQLLPQQLAEYGILNGNGECSK